MNVLHTAMMRRRRPPTVTESWRAERRPEHTKDWESSSLVTLLETGSDIIFFWVARMIMI